MRSEAIERGYACPDLSPLEKWVEQADTLSYTALEEYCMSLDHEDPVLQQTLLWSREVDANIAHIVRNVAPFPNVRQALEKFHKYADVVIVSATPHEAIVREWNGYGLLEYVTEVAGQELGSKAECIKKASSGYYAPDHILMIGDAPGDHTAAEVNGVLFYPIIPGREVNSWKHAQLHITEQLFNGSYKGANMEKAISDFNDVLLNDPNWQNYMVSFVRLTVIPFAIMLLLKLLPESFADMRMAVFIAASCPVGANVAVYAQIHDKDYPYAIETVIITTLLSVIALPLMVFLANVIW